MLRASLLALLVVSCSDVPRPSPEVVAWARQVLSLPSKEVCEARGHLCSIRTALVPPAVAALRANYLHVWRGHVVLDFGGGHYSARGLLIGPPGFVPEPVETMRTTRIEDGVYSFTTIE